MSANAYRIEQHEHGIVVRDPIPVSDLGALVQMWSRERGVEIFDSLIAAKIGATAVLCSREASKAWRKELGVGDGEEA